MQLKNEDVLEHLEMMMKNQQYIICMFIVNWFLLILLIFVFLINAYDNYNRPLNMEENFISTEKNITEHDLREIRKYETPYKNYYHPKN